jgi:Tetratricopeptide repeat
VAAFWASSALFRNRVPLAALGLLSLNTTFFEWGTTVRGYGLGSALIVLAFGCLGSLLVEPRRGRLVTATIACFLAVQVLLYNTVLLLAISGAATAVLLFQRNFKRAFVLAGISGAALVSFLPYLPAYLRARDWNILVRGAPSFYSLWKHAEVALGNPGYSIPALWYSIVLGLAGVFILRMWNGRREQSVAGHERIWFALIVCGFSVAGCFVFLRILSYTTSAWYYLALICLVTAALDLIASTLCLTTWLRLVRLGFGSAALIAAPFADWSATTELHTNVDVVAGTVAQQAAPNDLIVVTPWPFGIPFQRYYHGTAMLALLGVFITERYRLVAVPGLLIFAALGLSILRKAFAAREFKNAAIYLALLALATISVAWPHRDRSLWALDAYNSGWQALESNNLSLAEKKLAVAYAYVPENPETLFALGNLRFAQNDPSAAQSFYRSVLNLDPGHKGAFNNLGVIAFDAKEYPEAEKWFRQAEDVDPRNAKTHFLLARVLLATGSREAAKSEIDVAIRLQPEQREFRELKQRIESGSR